MSSRLIKQSEKETRQDINLTFLKPKASLYRSSRLQMFFETDVLKNFSIFTGKHLCRGFFFNKVAGLHAWDFIKKRLQYRCFPVNIAKFLRTAFIKQHLRWLLLFVKKLTGLNYYQWSDPIKNGLPKPREGVRGGGK